MDFGHNLIQVVAEFVDTDFLFGRDEDAGRLLFGNPAVLELFQRAVHGLFGREGEFVVGLVGVGVHLVEHHIHGFIGRADIPERPFHHFHLLLEAGMGDVHHVHQDIGLADLVQGALERLHQLGGQLTDEAYGV